jgi:RimJ/RimL family protein N-acetyltransferase/AcrR family transcriptional regulator
VEQSRGSTASRRGRPAAAAAEDVLALAEKQYLAGERVDLTLLAARLGLGRATIYRWFGSRERLLGQVVAKALVDLIAAKRQRVRRRGAIGLLEVFDQVNRSLAHSPALHRLLEQEPSGALRMLTSSDGEVQPRAVAAVQALIETETQAGRYSCPADPHTLAYAIVRLAEAFLYNDASTGVRGDHERLHSVEAALLGVPVHPGSGPARAEPTPQPRLVLRPLSRADAPELRRIHQTEEVRRWWDDPAEDFPWEDPESTRLTILVDGTVAGLIQYVEENEPKYRHAAVDIFLDPAQQGRGLGTEAIRQLVRELIHERGHHRITIDPAVDNAAAIRAYQKAGFEAVGVMRRYERDGDGPGWHDGLLMELVIDEDG